MEVHLIHAQLPQGGQHLRAGLGKGIFIRVCTGQGQIHPHQILGFQIRQRHFPVELHPVQVHIAVTIQHDSVRQLLIQLLLQLLLQPPLSVLPIRPVIAQQNGQGGRAHAGADEHKADKHAQQIVFQLGVTLTGIGPQYLYTQSHQHQRSQLCHGEQREIRQNHACGNAAAGKDQRNAQREKAHPAHLRPLLAHLLRPPGLRRALRQGRPVLPPVRHQTLLKEHIL